MNTDAVTSNTLGVGGTSSIGPRTNALAAAGMLGAAAAAYLALGGGAPLQGSGCTTIAQYNTCITGCKADGFCMTDCTPGAGTQVFCGCGYCNYYSS